MATRTERTQSSSILMAQRMRDQLAQLQRRLDEHDGQLRRLNTALTERNAELDRARSEAFRGILRIEIVGLEEQIAERNNEREDVMQQIGTFRTELQGLTGRVETLESGHLTLRGEVDGLQANSNAHATAISEIQDRLNAPWFYVPIALVIFFFAGWLMLEALFSLPLWRDLVISGAIGCVAAGIVASIGFGGRTTRVAATASSGAMVVAPQPPADQPAPDATQALPAARTDEATPPPAPPSGNQFSTVQAAAAASASAGN